MRHLKLARIGLAKRLIFCYNETMKEKLTPETIKSKECKERFGCDTRLRAVFVRHAQKRSGEVFADEGGLSLSPISERGEKESEIFGERIEKPAQKGYAGRISPSERTEATFNAIEKGYTKLGEAGNKFKTRIRVGLFVGPSGEMEDIYSQKFSENKDKLLAKEGTKPEDFSKLSPDKQEEIAEAAEEPVVEEWIFNKKSKMHRLLPPEDSAARMAVMAGQYVRMPDKFYSGSELDIFNATHKTVTEPLLAEILVLPNGKKIKSLQEIGGSLGTLDSWELDIKNDEKGNKDVRLLLRRKMRTEGEKTEFEEKEYGVDLKRLEELAKRGIELNRKEKEEREK